MSNSRSINDITFRVLDLIARDGSVEATLDTFLAQNAANKFNIVFVFRLANLPVLIPVSVPHSIGMSEFVAYEQTM
jgi:hypothetical protein